MNELKQSLDRELDGVSMSADFAEVCSRYKKRKRRRASALGSVVCVLLAAVFAVGLLIAPATDKNGFTVVVHATEIGSAKQPVKDQQGVRLVKNKVVYNSDGSEATDGDPSLPGRFVGSRAVLEPSPVSLNIVGKGIESYDLECTENGMLYNETVGDLNRVRVSYKGNASVSWMPSCNLITKTLTADITKVPSDIVNDRLATSELKALLKTADDYTKYFGDTVIITVYFEDGSSQTAKTVITLDEHGRYYISTVKKEEP